MKFLILLAQLFLGFEMFSTEWKMNDIMKEARDIQNKIKEIEVKPNIYFIVDVKDPKKFCRTGIKYCYIAKDQTLTCDILEKALPPNVSHITVCAQQ